MIRFERWVKNDEMIKINKSVNSSINQVHDQTDRHKDNQIDR